MLRILDAFPKVASMKTALTLVALVLLSLPAAGASTPGSAPSVQPAPPPASPSISALDRSPEAALDQLLGAHRPANRTYSCYDQVYAWCLSSCYELSQTNGCDFFANQECLCERSWADCPACY